MPGEGPTFTAARNSTLTTLTTAPQPWHFFLVRQLPSMFILTKPAAGGSQFAGPAAISLPAERETEGNTEEAALKSAAKTIAQKKSFSTFNWLSS